MKTGHIILIGGVVTALVFKDKIIPYVSSKAGEIEDKAIAYLTNKINIQPSGLPKVGVNFVKGAVTLGGVIDLTSKTGFTATLNTYQIKLVLEKGAQKIILASTPIQNPNKVIVGNTKTPLKYSFAIPLESISKIMDTKDVEGFQLNMYVDHLKVNSVDVPSTKIDISRTWQDMAKTIKNPASLITDIYNGL
ncbi:hypothetical protein [Labilibaculum antarcticum]|uniref:Uncharacterized protein n=1 Tax=Labilibaculum antarcticum TaxID=1717717 RepID=A0A1Y1CFB5_9BACT|nr:hypothetical protein [Labilibaculum antarcticum]BAX79047.1 hypothetical protein ALGA_0658 [Labilibaculum antarcticum]